MAKCCIRLQNTTLILTLTTITPTRRGITPMHSKEYWFMNQLQERSFSFGGRSVVFDTVKRSCSMDSMVCHRLPSHAILCQIQHLFLQKRNSSPGVKRYTLDPVHLEWLVSLHHWVHATVHVYSKYHKSVSLPPYLQNTPFSNFPIFSGRAGEAPEKLKIPEIFWGFPRVPRFQKIFFTHSRKLPPVNIGNLRNLESGISGFSRFWAPVKISHTDVRSVTEQLVQLY